MNIAKPWLIRLGPIVVAGALLTACSGGDTASDTDPTESASVAAVATAEVHPGEETYQNYCFSCHAPGLSGAPRLGDVEAWAPRIAKGPELLLQTTIAGIQPAMPPRGMCFSCTDEDLAAAVDYMIAKSR